MSRSYKKSPVATDQSCSRKYANGRITKVRKRQANKRVRRTKDISNGGSFKKVSESWNINDFSYISFNINR